MDAAKQSVIDEFDKRFTNNRIQMLKVLSPYLDIPMQKYLSVYIKFNELQNALKLLNTNTSTNTAGCFDYFQKKKNGGFKEMLEELVCFSSKEDAQKIHNLLSVFENIEKYKEIIQTMELFSDFMPQDGGNAANEGGMNDILMNMLSPEQKDLFEMLGGLTNGD